MPEKLAVLSVVKVLYFSVFFLFILSACSTFRTVSEYGDAFIGEGGTNCGEVKYGENAGDVRSCILEGLRNAEDFYAWYWLQPIDSLPASGILFRGGVLHIAWYDSGEVGGDSHFVSNRCVSWELNRDAKKPIVCDVEAKKKVFLFELNSLIRLREVTI